MVLSADAPTLDLLIVKPRIEGIEEPLLDSVNNGLKNFVAQVRCNFIKPEATLAIVDYALIRYFEKAPDDANSRLDAYYVLEDLADNIEFGSITNNSNLKFYLNQSFASILKQKRVKTFKQKLKH